MNQKAQVSKLREIFKTLPMALTPSYLYHRYPTGFKISKQPGFLTSQGALLFSKTASQEQFLKPAIERFTFEQQVWEGQLFVPVWEPHLLRFLTSVSLLMIWLYLDLPQYITPTPGISPSILIMKQLDKILGTSMSVTISSTSDSDVQSILWEWIFFAFHVLKVIVVWVILFFGAINPISFNPLKWRESQRVELTQTQLLAIGWTGARRVSPAEWREENRLHQIKRAGGISEAFKKGILNELPKAGLFLGMGEGFDTPTTNITEKNVDGKFLLSPKYFKTLYKSITAELKRKDMSDEEKGALLKSFRRSGPLDGPELLQSMYKERMKLGPGTILRKAS